MIALYIKNKKKSLDQVVNFDENMNEATKRAAKRDTSKKQV